MPTSSPSIGVERDVHWLAGTDDVTPAQADALAAYLSRLQRHRFIGGWVGVAFAFLFGIRWDQSVHLGIGGGHPLGDVLYCGLTGVVVGALSAETYRLSEPPSPIVAASLEPRQLEVPALQHRARLILGITLAWALVQVVLGHGWAPLAIAVAGLASTAVSEATHRAIEDRRRPVLSDQAAAVDRHLRRFAITASTHLQLAAAYLTAGWVAAKSTFGAGAEGEPTRWDLLLAIVIYPALFLCVGHLRRSAPRPPRRSPRPPARRSARRVET